MHYTDEILRALKADPLTESYKPQVLPADDVLPALKGKEKFLIIGNTDPSWKDGQHWVLFFKKNKYMKPIFFDSYGKKPSYYFPNWVTMDNFRRSTEDYQQKHTTVCGDHSLYVARRLAKGHSFSSILKTYHKNDEKTNDEFVFYLVHKKFKFLQKNAHKFTASRKFLQKCQSCKPRKV